MLKVYLLCLLSSLACPQNDSRKTTAPEEIVVKFELHSTALDNDAEVFITGNLPELGNWNPSSIQMKPVGKHKWLFELKCPSNYPIEYKYTLGSWVKEGADASGRPLENLVNQSKTDTIIKDRIEFWTTSEGKPVAGQITGTVKYHRQMKAAELLPRDVIVWLPPGYEQTNDRYPVLYMQDGQNIVDPKTSSFGVDWQIDETCTELIQQKKLQPLIVVGIYNTRERAKEYLPGKPGHAYASFVVDVVKPMIDKTYRTKPDEKNTAVGGSSAGGICAFRMAWNHPDTFSRALCMSPSFRYKRPDGSLGVDYVKLFQDAKLPEPVPYFYLDNGGIGLEKLLQPGIDEMLQLMQEKGLVEGKHYTWKFFPEARHNEAAWASRMPQALQIIFGKK